VTELEQRHGLISAMVIQELRRLIMSTVVELQPQLIDSSISCIIVVNIGVCDKEA